MNATKNASFYKKLITATDYLNYDCNFKDF